MKSRLSALFLATFLLISIGFFAANTHAFAAGTYDNAITSLLEIYSPSTATFQNNYNDKQKAEYNYDIQTLKGILADHAQRESPDLGDSAFKIRSLNDFIKYLKGKDGVQTDLELKKVTADAYALSEALHDAIGTSSFGEGYYLALSSGAGVIPNVTELQNAAQAQLNTVQQKGAPTGDKCSFSFAPGASWSFLGCADVFFAWIIKTFLLSFASVFAWFFGTLLHYSIYYGVLDFASQGGIGGTLLYPIWKTIRDIVNLMVVFFGLGLVILYLINQGDTLKKFIPRVILYALFVNFSWMASRTLVDYSNIITLKTYNAAVPNALSIDSNITAATKIMEDLGIQDTVLKVNGSDGTSAKFLDQVKSTPVALLLVAMTFYVAYIFFIASIIFMMRTALLIFFIIASPFLLLDTTIPWVGAYAEKARTIFFSQLIVGEVFMIFLFVVIQIMSVIKKGVTGSLDAISNGAQITANQGPLMFFGIIMMLIMLTIMMKVVKKLSGDVGAAVSKVAGTGLAFAGGGAGFALRGTLGAGAARFAASNTLDRMQDTRIGRTLKSGVDKLATGTYDFRNLKPIQSVAKSGGYTPVNMGTPLSQGADQIFANKEKQVNAKADSIRDKDTRESYLQNQKRGLFGLNEKIDARMPNGDNGDYRSAAALIYENRRIEEYKKASTKEREEMMKNADPSLKKRMEEIDKKTTKEYERRKEEIAEKEKMKEELKKEKEGQASSKKKDQTQTTSQTNTQTASSQNTSYTYNTDIKVNGVPVGPLSAVDLASLVKQAQGAPQSSAPTPPNNTPPETQTATQNPTPNPQPPLSSGAFPQRSAPPSETDFEAKRQAAANSAREAMGEATVSSTKLNPSSSTETTSNTVLREKI